MGYGKHFLSEEKPQIDQEKLNSIVRHALVEDIGKGDITTQLVISPEKEKEIEADILVKEDCIVCGLQVMERVFKTVDSKVTVEVKAREARKVKKGKVIAHVRGKASSIITAERVALNLLSMLCAVATKTREFVNKIEPYKVKITDTRKTIPGVRELQKYAVRIGGGFNHRMSLDEMILMKDNHIRVTEGYTKLPSVPKGFKIEIEVQNIEEFKHALRFKPDVIMLDNMQLKDIKKAVKIRNNTTFDSHHPRTKLEVSGGINLKNIRNIAASGVEIISIGELTHSIEATDISLDVK